MTKLAFRQDNESRFNLEAVKRKAEIQKRIKEILSSPELEVKDLYDLAVENGFEYDEVFICVGDDFFKHRFKLNENMINLSEDDVSIEVYV